MALTPIDDGLPADREAWPPDLLEHLKAFSQGDVVERPPFLYHADLANPVWRRTLDYVEAGFADPQEAVLANEDSTPPFGVVTTQTCDISEEDAGHPSKPWIQLAPVFDGSATINSGFRRLLADRRGPRHLFHLPGVPADGFWVADLRIEIPVEKGWLLGRQPIRVLADARSRAQFSEMLGRIRTRPAFAGAFVETVQRPLVERLRDQKTADAEHFARLDEQVIEARVQMDDPLAPKVAQVVFITDTEIDDQTRAWFDQWWDGQVGPAAHAGVDLLPNDYRSYETMTAAEYRTLLDLPLDRVSPE